MAVALTLVMCGVALLASARRRRVGFSLLPNLEERVSFRVGGTPELCILTEKTDQLGGGGARTLEAFERLIQTGDVTAACHFLV
jgi:hypothetical protein